MAITGGIWVAAGVFAVWALAHLFLVRERPLRLQRGSPCIVQGKAP